MKKLFLLFSFLSFVTLSCNKETPASGGGDTPTGPSLVQIDPIITKVTTNAFEQGDQIGLFMDCGREEPWAANAKLVYDGTLFSGTQKWYEQADEATLMAYHPYNMEMFPTFFSVALDQSTGTASSDLLTAFKRGVLPTSAPVSMAFSHQMGTLVVNVTNNTDGEVTEMTLSGTKPTAILNETMQTLVDVDVPDQDIVMYKVSDTQYKAIVVPQRTTFVLKYKLDGDKKGRNYDPVEFKAGETKTVNLVIDDEGVLEEHLDLNYILYHGECYTVLHLSNGRWIMNQSMRYVPKGKTISDNPADGNGVWYPYNSDGTTVSADKTDAAIEARGLLYDHQVAFGAEITAENFKTFEGCQGICPERWHIPTHSEWLAIVGYSNHTDDDPKAITDKTAIFYDEAYNGGRIKTMGEAGFNWDFAGSIKRNSTEDTGSYLTTITSDSNCSVADWMGKNSVSYYMGSTGFTPSNTAIQRQFMSLMTNFSASYKEGKAQVAYSNFLGGYSLRCIRDAE